MPADVYVSTPVHGEGGGVHGEGGGVHGEGGGVHGEGGRCTW